MIASESNRTHLFARVLGALFIVAVSVAPHLVTAHPTVAVQDCLLVVIDGLRNDHGHVRMGLYASADRWPQRGGEVSGCVATIQGQRAVCGFTRVARGSAYAVAAQHDENDNQQFDQNVLGVPLEGYAFSNDALPMLAPPSFDDCKVTFRGGIERIGLHAHY